MLPAQLIARCMISAAILYLHRFFAQSLQTFRGTRCDQLTNAALSLRNISRICKGMNVGVGLQLTVCSFNLHWPPGAKNTLGSIEKVIHL